MDTQKFKTLLETEKTKLETELKSFAKEDKNIKGNWATNYPSKERGNKEEEADEAGEYENLLSVEESLEVKLKEVNLALEKISNGTYGTCERCGKEIEPERLEAYPQAKLCMQCNENK